MNGLARMPSKTGVMSKQERVFADAVARTGNPRFGAIAAGYGSPEARASDNMKKPAILAEIRRQQTERLHEMGDVALDVVHQIMTDEKESGRTRLTAAKIVLDRVHGQVSPDAGAKEAHEMTHAELVAASNAIRLQLEGRMVDVTPKADEPASDPSLFD